MTHLFFFAYSFWLFGLCLILLQSWIQHAVACTRTHMHWSLLCSVREKWLVLTLRGSMAASLHILHHCSGLFFSSADTAAWSTQVSLRQLLSVCLDSCVLVAFCFLFFSVFCLFLFLFFCCFLLFLLLFCFLLFFFFLSFIFWFWFFLFFRFLFFLPLFFLTLFFLVFLCLFFLPLLLLLRRPAAGSAALRARGWKLSATLLSWLSLSAPWVFEVSFHQRAKPKISKLTCKCQKSGCSEAEAEEDLGHP